MNTVHDSTDSDRAVTESADRAEFAARAVERLMATGRAIGLPDDVIVETALRAVREVQQGIVRDGLTPRGAVVGRIADVEVAIEQTDGEAVVTLGAIDLTPMQAAELSRLLVVAGFRADQGPVTA